MKLLSIAFFVLLLFSCATTPAPIHQPDYLLALNSVMQFPYFISNEKYLTCDFTTNISKQIFQYKYKDNGLLEQITVNRTFTKQETLSPYTVDLFWDDNRRLVKTEMKTKINEEKLFLNVEFFYTGRNSFTLDHIIENNGAVIQYKKTIYLENSIEKIETYFIKSINEKPTGTPLKTTVYAYEDKAISKITSQETASPYLFLIQTFRYTRDNKNKITGFTATQKVQDGTDQNKYNPVTYTAVFKQDFLVPER